MMNWLKDYLDSLAIIDWTIVIEPTNILNGSITLQKRIYITLETWFLWLNFRIFFANYFLIQQEDLKILLKNFIIFSKK